MQPSAVLSYESVWQGRVRPWEVSPSPMLIGERRVALMEVLSPLLGVPKSPPGCLQTGTQGAGSTVPLGPLAAR